MLLFTPKSACTGIVGVLMSRRGGNGLVVSVMIPHKRLGTCMQLQQDVRRIGSDRGHHVSCPLCLSDCVTATLLVALQHVKEQVCLFCHVPE
jgi:hypothetical protein